MKKIDVKQLDPKSTSYSWHSSLSVESLLKKREDILRTLAGLEREARENDCIADTISIDRKLEECDECIELRKYLDTHPFPPVPGTDAGAGSAELQKLIRMGDRSKTRAEAAGYYRQAAEGGDPEAMFKFTRASDDIHGMLKHEMIWRAAKMGYLPAVLDTGFSLCLSYDKERGMEFYFAAAAAGSSQAFLWIAHNYKYGVGVPKDQKLADQYRLKFLHAEPDDDAFAGCRWLGRSHAADYRRYRAEERRESLIWLAECYEKGNKNLGIVPDPKKVLELYEQIGGEYYINLAEAYLSGTLVARSTEKATEYLEKAADGAGQSVLLEIAEKMEKLGCREKSIPLLEQALCLMEKELRQLETDSVDAAAEAYAYYKCDTEKMFKAKKKKILALKKLLENLRKKKG